MVPILKAIISFKSPWIWANKCLFFISSWRRTQSNLDPLKKTCWSHLKFGSKLVCSLNIPTQSTTVTDRDNHFSCSVRSICLVCYSTKLDATVKRRFRYGQSDPFFLYDILAYFVINVMLYFVHIFFSFNIIKIFLFFTK